MVHTTEDNYGPPIIRRDNVRKMVRRRVALGIWFLGCSVLMVLGSHVVPQKTFHLHDVTVQVEVQPACDDAQACTYNG